MQIRAPFRGGSDKTTFSRTAVELSCTIDSRPLSTGQVGAVADILRVRVELLDLHGNVVSLDAVAADLIYRYGSSHGGHHEDYFSQNSRPWLIKYWKTQLVSLFKKAKKPSIVDEDSTPSVELLAQEAATNSPDGDGAAEYEAEPHFSIPSSWNASSYPDYRSTHCRPHRRCPKPNNAFMHLVRGIIFPTVLGAVASLVACLFGLGCGKTVVLGIIVKTTTASLRYWISTRKPQPQPQICGLTAVIHGQPQENRTSIALASLTDSSLSGDTYTVFQTL